MAADLYIHVKTKNITIHDLKAFFSRTLGSKWYGYSFNKEQEQQAYQKISKTPSIHIGEVSWLKAAFLGEREKYIPSVVQAVEDIIDERLPVIDDKLISQISEALDLQNKTSYFINNKTKIIEWLEKYKGEKVFTISW